MGQFEEKEVKIKNMLKIATFVGDESLYVSNQWCLPLSRHKFND